jgi:hypothetical protein
MFFQVADAARPSHKHGNVFQPVMTTDMFFCHAKGTSTSILLSALLTLTLYCAVIGLRERQYSWHDRNQTSNQYMPVYAPQFDWSGATPRSQCFCTESTSAQNFCSDTGTTWHMMAGNI